MGRKAARWKTENPPRANLGEGEKRGRRRADEDEMLVANGIPDTG